MTYFNNAHQAFGHVSATTRLGHVFEDVRLVSDTSRGLLGYGRGSGGAAGPPVAPLKKMKFPAYCRQKHLRHLPRIFRTFGKGKGGHCLGVKVDGPPSANPEGGTPRGRGKACSKILRDDGTLDLDPPCVAPPISEGLTLPRKGRLPSHSDTFLF